MSDSPTPRVLQQIGLTQDQFDQILKDDTTKGSFGARWAVRWHGRLVVWDGGLIFRSQEKAREHVVTWLRYKTRMAIPYFFARQDIEKPILRSWGYTKAFREFIDDCVDEYERRGWIEYVLLDPEVRNSG